MLLTAAAGDQVKGLSFVGSGDMPRRCSALYAMAEVAESLLCCRNCGLGRIVGEGRAKCVQGRKARIARFEAIVSLRLTDSSLNPRLAVYDPISAFVHMEYSFPMASICVTS